MNLDNNDRVLDSSVIDEVEHIDFQYEIDRHGYVYKKYLDYKQNEYSIGYRFANALKVFTIPFILFVVFFVFVLPTWFSFLFLLLGFIFGYIAFKMKKKVIYNMEELNRK